MVKKVISAKNEKKFIDKFIYVAAILAPLTTVPQIIDIFTNKSSTNVSLLTWALCSIFALILLWYSIQKKLRPLIIQYTMWFILETIVVIGIIIYS